MNESPNTRLQGEHSEIMKAGKLGYKLQRYGAIFKELKNWPEYLAFKMGIHPGKDFVFNFKCLFIEGIKAVLNTFYGRVIMS